MGKLLVLPVFGCKLEVHGQCYDYDRGVIRCCDDAGFSIDRATSLSNTVSDLEPDEAYAAMVGWYVGLWKEEARSGSNCFRLVEKQ